MTTQVSDQKKWYDKRWITIILCIIFPPIGFYALWKCTTISKGWKIGIVIVCGLAFINRLSNKDDANTSQASKSSSVTAQPAASPVDQKPADQKRFIQIVKQAQSASRSAANDMARGGALAIRNNALKNEELDVTSWIGVVTLIYSNSDGWGVLVIEIAKDVSIQTWNNSISDMSSDTLIKPGSALFNAAASLKLGQTVKFSGQFIRDDETGVGEQSMSLQGKLEEPEFTFKFSSLSGL